MEINRFLENHSDANGIQVESDKAIALFYRGVAKRACAIMQDKRLQNDYDESGHFRFGSPSSHKASSEDIVSDYSKAKDLCPGLVCADFHMALEHVLCQQYKKALECLSRFDVAVISNTIPNIEKQFDGEDIFKKSIELADSLRQNIIECNATALDGSQAKKGIQFGGDRGYETTKTLVDLVANKNFSDDANGSGLSALRNKKVDAYFSGSWDYDAVKKALGKNFGAAQLPTVKINGQDQQLKSFAGSKAIGVNPNSKNMEVAVKLAAYLGGEKAQKDHYTLRSIIPCNTKLLKESDIKSDPLIAAQNNTINNTSILQPTITEMGNYWTPVETFGKALVAKQVNASNYKKKTDAFQKSLNTDVTK